MIETSSITREILSLIEDWEQKLASLPTETISQRRNSQDRTIKQILGHLIDSTSNNTHRIIHLQYQSSPLTFPNYATFGNNDRWIAIQDYQNENFITLIQLWKYSLLHFCHVIKNVENDKLNSEWISGPDQKITLESMIVDFPRHLKLHLNEINDLINNNFKSIMTTSAIFDRTMIAPCGMNCGTCISYLRPKNKCIGCRIHSPAKRTTRVACVVKNCINLEQTSSKFCYDCEKFPCKRINQLDNRYRTKYNTSFIENLTMIKEKGIDRFLEFESKRRTCSNCGSVLSVHRDKCLSC